MTAQTNQPAKFLVPFAQNDTSRVEIPVTTSDATRASQSAGFPPLTMQPPESGGVPPQGEDFNGAMNQVARIAWWLMLGGRFAFDNAFATASQIGGYPKGAVLQGLDAAGDWINTTDNNTTNPDTSTDPAGGGYVPGYQYGVTALTGLTGGTVTLTNAQAAKSTLTLAGALTSALIVVVPTWRKRWSVTNNTIGAFAVTIKTAVGTGIAIPQNGSPTEVTGDGTNITFPAQNIPAATDPNQPLQLGQAVGRLLRRSVYAISGGSQKVSVNGGTFTSTGATTWSPLSNTATVVYEGCGGGGGGGGAGGQGSSTIGLGQSGGGGAFGRGLLTSGFSGAQTVTVGTGGIGGTSTPTNGGSGTATTFGGIATWPGGVGGAFINGVAVPAITGAPAGGGTPTGPNVTGSPGEAAGNGFAVSTTVGVTGKGGSTPYGAGGAAVAFGTAGQAGGGNGSGGSGGAVGGGGSGLAGGNGAGGLLIIDEYA